MASHTSSREVLEAFAVTGDRGPQPRLWSTIGARLGIIHLSVQRKESWADIHH